MKLSAQDKVNALRDLTIGAPDCFAMFAKTRRVGQARWGPVYSSLSDQTMLLHMKGSLEIGTYPVIPTSDGWPRVYWICADFDGKKEGTDWKGDVQRAVEFLMDFDGCPCFVNLSRSGHGAHVRMLFKDSVPAWLARRWLTSWLTEAQILKPRYEDDEFDDYDMVEHSFDRFIPPQDTLSPDLTAEGHRRPGNLAGAPLHGAHARRNGGTLPLSTKAVALGNFEPDGRHWEHVMTALEQRAWGEAELLEAMGDCPDEPSTTPPATGYTIVNGVPHRSLPVIAGSERELEYAQMFCEFFRYMRSEHMQPYPLWMALATQLHRFGEDGYRVFHEISGLDSRYTAADTDQKWEQTRTMRPVRCDTLSYKMGWTCPLLRLPACNGPKAPTYFAQSTAAEIL